VGLALVLLPGFAITTAITQAYRADQRRLAAEWFERGTAALDAGRAPDAVEAFRSALAYAREDRQLRLMLAQALAEAGRAGEARAWLLTLRETQPGNGPVNLQLARLAASSGNIGEAHLFYHAALEGAWPDMADAQRRAIRLELAELLVARGRPIQAQAELVALEGDLPPAAADRQRVADLMRVSGLHDRSFRMYERVLAEQPQNAAARAGAGLAAFASGRYATARPLLARAVAGGETDPEVVEALTIAQLIADLDPSVRRLSLRARTSRARRALETARARLAACVSEAGTGPFADLQRELEAIAPHFTGPTVRELEHIDVAMDVVFRIEEAASARCGEPSGADRALLLLGRQGGAS
jgi:thioredoxin-like negative regulator of GroEL